MNIVLNIKDISTENIYLLESKKNIIMDGSFTKLLYSNPFLTMNSIYCITNIEITSNEIVNKNFSTYNIYCTPEMIQECYELEKSIINFYKNEFNIVKESTYLLYKQLMSYKIKLYKESNISPINVIPSIVLKISGLWETNNEIGITYKFLEMYT
jgi:hypothetical protein